MPTKTIQFVFAVITADTFGCVTGIWQANTADRIIGSAPTTFEFCLQSCIISIYSGDERRSVVSAFAALGSLTLCAGSGWRREALSWTTTSCRTSSSVSQRSQRG